MTYTFFCNPYVQISVYRNKIIIDELSKEHRKLCRAVKDAEKIQNEAELFAVISHEIKTPLNVIQGFSKEIEEYRPAVPSEANSFAKHISEASSHILDIISELLLLFQLKKSRGEFWSIRHRPIDLHAFWRTTCEKVWMMYQSICDVVVARLHTPYHIYIYDRERERDRVA